MARPLRFRQVDVFSSTPLRGNPVAVVVDGEGLDEATMQAFARWTNLSETTFLLAPTDPRADYRLRIFTPESELPFAGHPTLGSCHAWLEAGFVPRDPTHVVQECGIGLVTLRSTNGSLAFAAPPLTVTEAHDDELSRVLDALGLGRARVREACMLDNGPRFLVLRLEDAASVLAIDPDHGALRVLPPVGLVGPHPEGHEAALEVRLFASSAGIPEDPVTGSLNAALAVWLIDRGLAPPRYVASQGTRLAREGRVIVTKEDGIVWIGGACTTCIEGSVRL